MYGASYSVKTNRTGSAFSLLTDLHRAEEGHNLEICVFSKSETDLKALFESQLREVRTRVVRDSFPLILWITYDPETFETAMAMVAPSWRRT